MTIRRPLSARLAASAALFAALMVAPSVFAQQDANVERGFAAEKVYSFGEVDSVNLFNGNLVLTIPIGGSYPVNGGLGYGLKLIYNSNIWDLQTRLEPVWENGVVVRYESFTQARVDTSFNAGAGWTLSLGRMFAPNHPDNPSAAGSYAFVGEDGGSHEFYQELHEGDPADLSTVLYSRDGSYLRLKLSSFHAATSAYLVADVESPEGTVRRFTRASGDWSVPFRLATIKDAFANTVTVTYPSASQWTIDDGHRLHQVHFTPKTVEGLTVLPSPDSISLAKPQTWNRYGYVYGNPLRFIDPTGAVVKFADEQSEAAYEEYKAGLGQDSEDYSNVLQLERSKIVFVINVEEKAPSNEGSLGFDGSNVLVNVDPGGPSSEMSLSSRMAHEFQHATQVDNGDIGFAKKGNRWTAIFNDINDEIGAWNAGVRQATARDLARGPLAEYNRANDKAKYLMKHGYEGYRGQGNKSTRAPQVPGFAPGSVVHTPAVFYRTPR